MRYAIFGDIHSNLHALEAVLAHAREQGSTHYVCTGDIVGYNAFPGECVELIRSLECPVVKGNHDELASSGELSDELSDGLNELAEEAIVWTRDHLNESEKQWLEDLRYKRQVRDFLVAHATLDTPEGWGYVFNPLDAKASFAYQMSPLCFIGHTHAPKLFVRESATGEIANKPFHSFVIQPGSKYLVNVGSVGQPRDQDWRASYVTYDVPARTVTKHRVEYDLSAAQAAVRAAGLHEHLAERLAQGR